MSVGFDSLFAPGLIGGSVNASHDGTSVEAGSAAGAGTFGGTTGAHDLLGGMVGGFAEPMDWRGAGFGMMNQGGVSNSDGGFMNAFFGGGLGAGYGSFSGKDDKGYAQSGVSGAVGGVAPVGFAAGNDDARVNASTNVYRAAGGSAYSYDNGTDSGVGAKGSYTPLGLANTDVGFSAGPVSAEAKAGNAYLNQLTGGVMFGQDAHGSYVGAEGGMRSGVDNASVSVDAGFARQSASVGSASYGYNGSGRVGYDPTTGTVTASGQGRGGGVEVTDANASGGINGVADYNAHVGSFSNDTIVSGNAEIDANHAKVTGSADGMGMRFHDVKANTSLAGGAITANASAGDLSDTNSIKDAYVDANWDKGSLGVGFDNLAYGGISGTDLKAGVTGPGNSKVDASLGSFSTGGITANKFQSTIDRNGVAASIGDADYNSLELKNANVNASIGDAASLNAHLGQLDTNHATVDHGEAGLTADRGLYLGAKSASYDSVGIKDASVDSSLGGGDIYKSHLALGEGSFNSFSGKNISAGIDGSGAHAGLEDGHYGYLQGKNIEAQQSFGGGAVGYGVGAKQASLGTVDVGKLDFHTDLETAHLGVDNLNAAGWKSQDIHANANVGDLGANVGAKTLNLADAHVGNVTADTSNYGLTGGASVSDAKVDAINMQGGHAGLSWDGKEMLGATADFRSGAGADSVKANYDLTQGTAGASFKNANVGAQLSNADINMFGYDMKIPDMGAKLNASGGADVDLMHGAASANLGLGGSSVNFAGHEMTVPDWVKASAGVNLSQGAANFNLGGDNGFGADMNLSKGDLKFDALGYELDVGQGVRDVGGAISDGAHAVGGAISDGAGAVADGASAAWDTVTDW